jgi:hypothetical protein
MLSEIPVLGVEKREPPQSRRFALAGGNFGRLAKSVVRGRFKVPWKDQVLEGTDVNSGMSPSANVGWARIASRNAV